MPRSSASPTAASGTVKWFNFEKGYGFVCQDDGGPDVFAHFSAIAGNGYRELTEGEKVAFDITQGQKGPRRPYRSCGVVDAEDPVCKMKELFAFSG
ncbi:cold shock domain-containing protein [Streptomyces misionensis]|uniref:cold shock domain-containing protein n=1 Tax=Streptomyces misionensis TaxID=67331 RepID=UPI0036FEC06C